MATSETDRFSAFTEFERDEIARGLLSRVQKILEESCSPDDLEVILELLVLAKEAKASTPT